MDVEYQLPKGTYATRTRKLSIFLRYVVIIFTVFCIVLILPPQNKYVDRIFPLLSSKTSDLEMGLFSTLISSYAIFFSFFVLAIEVLDSKRLIEIRDLLEDKLITYGTIIFLIFTFLPIILIAFGVTEPTEPRYTFIHLVFYTIAGILLILMVVHLFRLLDSIYFIGNLSRRVLKNLQNFRNIREIKDLVRLRVDYITQLNRFYDAARIAIESFDSHTLTQIESALLNISLKIEESWASDFMGETLPNNSKVLVQKINEKKETKHLTIRDLEDKTSREWNRYEMIGEFIWEPIYRVRNIGEQLIPYPKYRSDYRYVPEVLIRKAINENKYLFVRGLANVYWKLLVESERNFPERKRAQEVLGHGIIGICAYLYKKYPKESERLFKEEIKTITSLPFTEGLFYHFKHLNEPVLDVLYNCYMLMVVLDFVTQENDTKDTSKIKAVVNQTVNQTKRLISRNFLRVYPEDVEDFYQFYLREIRKKVKLVKEDII